MAAEFEFLSPTDKPALLGLSMPDWLAKAKAALVELGYKVHEAANHNDFAARFGQSHYQVVVIEETFDAPSPAQNVSLQNLQRMQMHQRRHAVIILLGESFQSLNALQAFQQSVHAVVHPAELDRLPAILQQVIADNDLFLHLFRNALVQVSTGGK